MTYVDPLVARAMRTSRGPTRARTLSLLLLAAMSVAAVGSTTSHAASAAKRCKHGYVVKRLHTTEHGRKVTVRRCCRKGYVLKRFRTRVHGRIRYRYHCVKRKAAAPQTPTQTPTTQAPTTPTPPAPTPAAPSEPTSNDPSGEAMPSGNLPGWRQVFADNFPYSVGLGRFPADTGGRWKAYPDGWHDTSGHGAYNCTKVCSVHDGTLDMWIHSENGVHYVAAPLPDVPRGITYGRYAIRFKADPLPRYKVAWLLWPDSETWPGDGEIDFPEGQLDGAFCAFMHHQGASSGSDQDAFCPQVGFADWHTAVTEWTPTAVRFYVDGNPIGTSTDRIPNTAMHWVLQTETEVSGDAPADSTQGHVYVDWAAIWRPA